VDCYRKKNQSRSVRSCSWIPTDHNFMFLFTVFISKIYIFCSRISIFIKTLQKTTNQKICFCLNMIQISKTKDKEIPTYLIRFVDYEKNFQYKNIRTQVLILKRLFCDRNSRAGDCLLGPFQNFLLRKGHVKQPNKCPVVNLPKRGF